MTAPAVTTAPPLQRVTCPCSWRGIRRNPTGRDCPACGGPHEKIETLWQVGHGPHQSIIYVLHFHWPYGRVDPWRICLADGSIVRFHADHYSIGPATSRAGCPNTSPASTSPANVATRVLAPGWLPRRSPTALRSAWRGSGTSRWSSSSGCGRRSPATRRSPTAASATAPTRASDGCAPSQTAAATRPGSAIPRPKSGPTTAPSAKPSRLRGKLAASGTPTAPSSTPTASGTPTAHGTKRSRTWRTALQQRRRSERGGEEHRSTPPPLAHEQGLHLPASPWDRLPVSSQGRATPSPPRPVRSSLRSGTPVASRWPTASLSGLGTPAHG